MNIGFSDVKHFAEFIVLVVILAITGSVIRWSLHRKGWTLTKHGKGRNGSRRDQHRTTAKRRVRR